MFRISYTDISTEFAHLYTDCCIYPSHIHSRRDQRQCQTYEQTFYTEHYAVHSIFHLLDIRHIGSIPLSTNRENNLHTFWHSFKRRERMYSQYSSELHLHENEEKLAITERIAQHSGVQEKLLSNNNYAGGISITGFQSEENNRDSNINSSFIYAAPNFSIS